MGDWARPAIFASLIRKPKAFPGPSSPRQTSTTSYWTDLCYMVNPTCRKAWKSAYLLIPCSIVERTKGARNWVWMLHQPISRVCHRNLWVGAKKCIDLFSKLSLHPILIFFLFFTNLFFFSFNIFTILTFWCGETQQLRSISLRMNYILILVKGFWRIVTMA